ncbi:MAG TPA: hypothetical protein PKC24_01750 [Cyclobacteriaceae bacterium]|nr:hypothetical protein [Cyclobacteriaceae bacterium]
MQKDFTQLFLLLMVLKLIFYLAYNTIFILIDTPGATANVVYFFSLYILLTLMESIFLFREINAGTTS